MQAADDVFMVDPFACLTWDDAASVDDWRSKRRTNVIVGSLFETKLVCYSCFEVAEGLWIDATISGDKFFHFLSDVPLDCKLIDIWRIECDRVLPEEVSDEHLFDVWLLAIAWARLWLRVRRGGWVSRCNIGLAQVKRLDCVHSS